MTKLKYSFLLLLATLFFSCSKSEITLITSENASNRIEFGLDKLSTVLTENDFSVSSGSLANFSEGTLSIVVGELSDVDFRNFLIEKNRLPADSIKAEGFQLLRSENTLYCIGADESGALYGLIELKNQIKTLGKLPKTLNLTDQPEMVMRGTCIGLQKTTYLPGRHVYEYPYTEENFPWFYDKEIWIKYLDMMVENRFNALYLWNGHPFASLVKLNDYPYAVEVDDATFKKNEEVFSFLTEEANKRGIWVIQMFYNIIVSKPFAEHNNLKTQDRNRPIVPIIADYTRKSIAAFIEKYPNVGLMVCLGEAMNSIEDDVEWFSKTIIPGVQDGLKALGSNHEPPIVLRGHDTDAEKVMAASLPIYKNLYTMFKYNGESLTTYNPRDSWESIPTALSKLGSVHISNVHILANLEPFRYGSPDFIQKSVKAMDDKQGANGLHLYPQASYWDWPYSADKANERINEFERDWMWYDAWARYAWKADRNREEEISFWANKLDQFYGSKNAGKNILAAYEESGEIAPKLLRTFGISDGNRQTLLLGMFMAQLVNPQKYNVYSNFWTSNGPVKEVLQVYANKEFKGEKHEGETPPQIIAEVIEHGRKSVEAIDAVSNQITLNIEEFERLRNDMHCYQAFGDCFAEKVKAAMLILNYKYSNNVEDLEAALPHLEKSLDYFSKLVELTNDSYLYANSMQTSQRRIPISGADGSNKTWAELLPHYQTEVNNFKRNLEMLKANGGEHKKNFPVLKAVDVKILSPKVERFSLSEGAQVYSDNKAKIAAVAEELHDLRGLRLSDNQQREEGTVLRFHAEKPVKLVVGYFNTNSYSVLEPPTLETNAAANDRGQADIKIANAIDIPGLYPVNIYTYRFDAGNQELILGKGRVLILGFIDANDEIEIHDAGMVDDPNGPAVDWLFY